MNASARQLESAWAAALRLQGLSRSSLSASRAAWSEAS